MMKALLIAAFILMVFMAACNQGYIVRMNESTNYPEGRNLFVSKCNACHQLYSPDRFNSAGWDSILVPMQLKAKINDEQRNAIYNWILEVKSKNSDSTRHAD
ncbi:MAG TPA: hypothetical protein VI230_00970 [Ignavibacteriaceae bacterium]